MFVDSAYLQSLIVYLPKQNLDKFLKEYEFENETILPKSFTKLDQKFDIVMGHFIAFKKGIDDIKVNFKDKFKGTILEFYFDVEQAKKEKDQK